MNKPSRNIREILKQRVASAPWSIIAAIMLCAYGWLFYERLELWETSFYLRSLTLPLVLALIVGAFPAVAPHNPEGSERFWPVASISFKLFLVVLVIVLLLFKLNSA